MKCFEPQRRDGGLDPSWQRVTLRGSPKDVVFPDICAHCGAATLDRLRVGKVFDRTPTGPAATREPGDWTYAVASADIPLCSACLAAHWELDTPMTPLERALSYARTSAFFGTVVALGLAVAMLPLVLPDRGPAASAAEAELVHYLRLLPLLLVVGAAGGAVGTWWFTRRFRVPAQTEVTRSLDFSDDLSGPGRRQFRAWVARNPEFLAAFVRANGDRVVQHGGRRSR